MPPNSEDPNPWYFGNEMTINGCCQGWKDSAPASSANGNTSNPGKAPASDRQPPVEDPNMNLANNRRRSTPKPVDSSSASVNNEQNIRSLRHEVHRSGRYSFSDNAQSLSALGVPRGYVSGSSPRERMAEQISGQNIPRSPDAGLEKTLLETYRSIIDDDDLTDARAQRAISETKLKVESTRHPAEMRDPSEPMKQRGKLIQNRKIEQNSKDRQNPSRKYRQVDINKDPEDADTDTEPFQDQNLDDNGGQN